MAIIVSLAAFFMTVLGGLLALYLHDRLHLILGFSAGAVIGVAFFDLIPEAIELGAPVRTPSYMLGLVAVGFVAYMILDRTIAPHGHKGIRTERLWQRGALGASSLAVHSLFDGFAIGLAFKVSAPVGAVVAAAVLAHDFSDGINTVGIVLNRRGGDRAAFGWLLIDAVAPVIGAASTLLVDLRGDVLAVCLALIAGFFIYISASDLLPESYHDHPTSGTTAMTILGIAIVYVAVRLAEV
ncbi:MAG TPA: ZIP family metal transporter [Stellaceae bacterium]|jgi:ZIP family zinc transporter|nr:ZIP family metal transporter [Stellaceae bacterium]